MKVTDIMTTDIQTCAPEATLQEVASKMQELDVGSIPISDGKKLHGIVTDRDIVTRGIAAQISLDAPVSQILSSDMITGTKDMDVEQAASVMAQNQIRRLPIVENDQVVGMVSLGDVAVKDPSNENAGIALEDISEPSEPE